MARPAPARIGLAMDFEHSERAQIVMEQVERFTRERIVPNEATYHDQLDTGATTGTMAVPPIVEELKAQAKGLGLWNLFLPDETHGAGLNNCDYAPVAELTGRSFLAPEVFNCAAPDTGNAEVLVQYGSELQKEQWLLPLLDGEIRSGFSMTEPAVASSDAADHGGHRRGARRRGRAERPEVVDERCRRSALSRSSSSWGSPTRTPTATGDTRWCWCPSTPRG